MLPPSRHHLIACLRSCNSGFAHNRRIIRSFSAGALGEDFTFIPDFLSEAEQHVLLAASLERLNEAESALWRRKRRRYEASLPKTQEPFRFLSDEYYQFEEVCSILRHHRPSSPNAHPGSPRSRYSPVNKPGTRCNLNALTVRNRYREMHLASWPSGNSRLDAVVDRLQAACPTKDTQTHLLHLASDGEIFPHVDNLEASGSWILGVSLGSMRVLRMHPPDGRDSVNVELPPGSLYIQKCALVLLWSGHQPADRESD
jgi:alkylated DNA repair protein alkB family protein 7